MVLTDHEIKGFIDDKNETPNLDYKQDLLWNKENREGCLEIIKDILAMSNTTDGGRIIFGVRDNDFEFLGISEESWKLFDVTPINELLHQFADPSYTCGVIKRVIDGKKTVVIDVPEFIEVPIICKSDGVVAQNKQILRKGAVYIRTTKCSSEAISSAEEMRSILGRGLVKKGDELFQSIQKLITGKPLKETVEVKELYLPEIKDGRSFFESNLTSNVGFWEILAHPTTYDPNLIPSPIEAGTVVSESVVRLRGWDFPHLDNHDHVSNFSTGKQSFTISETVQVQEAWRMYKSGLFIWKEYMAEDLRGFEEGNSKVLFFVSTIYAVTEYMLFFKRLYAEKLAVDTLHIQITLNGCKNRKLGEGQPGLLNRNYECFEDKIILDKDIKTIDLRASFESVARQFIKELFMQFNWNDPSDSMLEDWQKKLIERGG